MSQNKTILDAPPGIWYLVVAGISFGWWMQSFAAGMFIVTGAAALIFAIEDMR